MVIRCAKCLFVWLCGESFRLPLTLWNVLVCCGQCCQVVLHCSRLCEDFVFGWNWGGSKITLAFHLKEDPFMYTETFFICKGNQFSRHSNTYTRTLSKAANSRHNFRFNNCQVVYNMQSLHNTLTLFSLKFAIPNHLNCPE